MIVFYKYSDKGKISTFGDTAIDKKKIFENFYRIFYKETIILVLDNSLDISVEWFKKNYSNLQMHITNLGNAKTMTFIYDRIKEMQNNNELVFISEDDYWYLDTAVECIKEGLQIADFVNLYDHPDKYMNPSPNPFVFNGGEDTKVFVTEHSHWKYSNSTTGTFGMRVETIKNNYDVMIKHNNTKPYIDDFSLFCDLKRIGKTLVTPIPSKSTHLDGVKNIAPIVGWEKIIGEKI